MTENAVLQPAADEPTDEEMTEELIALIEQRAATYGMIARLYRSEVESS